jgi:tetratricopeptide (TPR) repeat protein
VTRLEQLQKLVALAPDDPLAHYGVGLEYMQLERWTEAIAAFEQTLRVDQQYLAALQQKARAELKLGDRAAARASLAAGLALAQARGERHAADDIRKSLETLS